MKALGQVDSFINDNRSLHEFFCLMHCFIPFPPPRKAHHRNFLFTLSKGLFKMNKTKKTDFDSFGCIFPEFILQWILCLLNNIQL